MIYQFDNIKMDAPRKTVRSTSAQLNILVDYMVENSTLANGEFYGPVGAQKLDDEWAALAERLSHHGPHKTVQQWKHTWRDLKKKARADSLRVLQAYNEAEARQIDSMPLLSSQSHKILKAIRHETAMSLEMFVETSYMNPEPDDNSAAAKSHQHYEDRLWRWKKRKEISDNEKEMEVPVRKRQTQGTKVDAIDILKELRTARDEFDVFGEHVAMKVRNLNNSHAKHTTQYLINNILYNAAMGEYDSPTFNPAFAVFSRSAVSDTSASPSTMRSSVTSPCHSGHAVDIKVEIADD